MVHTLDFTFPGVARSTLPACWPIPRQEAWVPSDQQELPQIVTASSTPPLVNTNTVSRTSVILRQILQIVGWDTLNMSATTI